MSRVLMSVCLAVLIAGCGGDGGGGEFSADAEDATSDAAPSDTAPDPPNDTATTDGGAPNDGGTATDASKDTSVTPADLDGPCPLASRYGAFSVQLQEEFSFVDGSVANGVIPVTVLEEVESLGDCRLLKRNNPFCSPPCAPGETCDHDGSCIPFPEPEDVGTVEITGLVAEAIMDPLQPGNSYFLTTLPHPAFEPGAAIRLTSTAGFFGELDLHGVGVDDLALGEVEWSLEENQPLELSWPAPATAGVPAEVAVKVLIDQHGLSPVFLVCAFPDTGEATIPASLVDALLSSGVSGYPTGLMSRRTMDSMAVGDGCMEFEVASPREIDVRVIGHTPCKSDGDCPEGETCNVMIETCG